MKNKKIIAIAIVIVVAIVAVIFAVKYSKPELNTGRLADPALFILTASCSDSDGSDLFVQGKTQSRIDPAYIGELRDTCRDSRLVIEYTCRPDGKVGKEVFKCPGRAVCRDGRCADPLTL